MLYDSSRDRSYVTTDRPSCLRGERILEAGSGTGRFTELALETRAEGLSFDLIDHVEAAGRNNFSKPLVVLLEASIYQIALPKGVFDRIFWLGASKRCLDIEGLSQHPSPSSACEIVMNVHEKPQGFATPKHLALSFLTTLGTEGTYGLISCAIFSALEVKKALHRVPLARLRTDRLIPSGPTSHTARFNNAGEELKRAKILGALKHAPSRVRSTAKDGTPPPMVQECRSCKCVTQA